MSEHEPQLPGFDDEEKEKPEEDQPSEWLAWVRRELAAGRNPGQIKQDDRERKEE